MATIVTPDTLMRWHRRLIANKWTNPTKPVGRPGLMKKIRGLIASMAKDNPSWGYARIKGELEGVGHKVARSAIAKVLKENGITPEPDRPSSWRAFLKAHWGQVAATDFFSTEVWTPGGLRTIYVLFVIDLKSRLVHVAGITRHPDGPFMARVARNLPDCVDGFLLPHRHLICDRDRKFTGRFWEILRDAGARTALTPAPAPAPNCNAFAERFVLSIKSECLNRMVFFGENSLRRAINEYVKHYNSERPHQGIGNKLLTDRPPPDLNAEIEVHERMGDLLKSYRRTG